MDLLLAIEVKYTYSVILNMSPQNLNKNRTFNLSRTDNNLVLSSRPIRLEHHLGYHVSVIKYFTIRSLQFRATFLVISVMWAA